MVFSAGGAARPPVEGTPLPPISGTLAVTPPITVSRPVNAVWGAARVSTPRVDSWDDTAYVCRAGDTYQSLSERYYHHPGYAKALRVYNRTHWSASPRISRDGEIVPGETIYLPPAIKLTDQHGNLIQTEAVSRYGTGVPNP
jgi:hypothetical protein